MLLAAGEVKYRIANHDIGEVVRKRHLLEMADLEVLIRQSGFEGSGKAAHMFDGGGVCIQREHFAALAQEVRSRLQTGAPPPAYLIRGHGAYAWGKDMEEAERVIEALEHLLSCEIEAIRLRNGVQA